VTASITALHAKPYRDVAAILAERRQHASALKDCDLELKNAWERACAQLEEASSALAETALPVGLREEARQLALELPERVSRAQRAAL
jgi:hypothetical protein